MSDQRRRAFIRSETQRLGRFLNVDHLRSWHRSYRCPCGFTCTMPGDIWDHSLVCKESVS